MSNQTNQTTKILRRPLVESKCGLSRACIYAYMKQGLFPKPVALGPRTVGWRESDIDEWIISRTEKAKEQSL